MHREISDRENVGIKACRMIVVPHLCSRERSSTYISRTSQASSHTHTDIHNSTTHNTAVSLGDPSVFLQCVFHQTRDLERVLTPFLLLADAVAALR